MLIAAIDLIRGYGLSGAGINDLVRASGAPRGSVYHFFPGGKSQIASEALAAYAVDVRAFIDQALASREAPPEKVEALFQALARRASGQRWLRSCAVGTVSLDLGDDEDALRPQLADALNQWAEAIAAHFPLGNPSDSRSFAGFVLSAIEGAYVRSRAERSSAAFLEAGRWLAKIVA